MCAGSIDPAILGVRGDGDANGLKQILSGDSESARSVRAGLERRGIDLAGARAVILFGADSRPGNSAEFKALRDGLLIVAAPGAQMQAGEQDTATPIRVHIQRSLVTKPNETLLPEPLADPLQDIRVNRSTAEAYFVRAGEYIQIIDVAGRQCSDFQCFSARKLDKGVERPLDATTTRRLTGLGYPAPGPARQRPSIRTCSRWSRSCATRSAGTMPSRSPATRSYYEDMGYPGHVNCTDNFNGALAPYGIAARKGWMALNFFYNTGIDANNVHLSSTSRGRGRATMCCLRALTDLVCVSSACPDDIDAANGWNPTDIHVRTYSDKQRFSRAVAYRMTPDAEPKLTRETAFHPRFSALTRNFTEYRGYWLPHTVHQ